MVRDGVGLERSLLLEAMGAKALSCRHADQDRGTAQPGERRLAERQDAVERGRACRRNLAATIGVAQKEALRKISYKTRDQVDKAADRGTRSAR